VAVWTVTNYLICTFFQILTHSTTSVCLLSISQFLSHNSNEDFFSLVTPLFIAIKDDSSSPYHSVLFWFLGRNNMMSFLDIYLTFMRYIHFFKGKCILVNMYFSSLVYQHVGTPFVGEQNRGHTALCSLLSIFRSKYCFLFVRLKKVLFTLDNLFFNINCVLIDAMSLI
jgi:hypothetical protein